MLNKVIRLSITAAILTWAVFQFIDGNIGNGISLVLLSGLVIFTFFRNERILISLWYMRKQDMAKAQKMLDGIKDPEASLTRGNRAYYYLLQGMIVSQTSVGKAETLVKKALNTGLNMDQDKAMAKLQLAGFAIAKGRKREATTLLTEVKKLDKRNVLAEQTKFMKQQLKKAHGAPGARSFQGGNRR